MKQTHPQAGKNFRINFGENLQAIYDTELQGKVIRLDDWVDRIEQSELNPRAVEVMIMFYAHRCLPDATESVSLASMNLEGLVYGTVVSTIGNRYVERVILREHELVEI